MKLSKSVLEVFNLFKDYDIFLVGGCVRDFILKKQPHDYDFASNATPQQVIDLCKINSIPCIPTGIRFGTVTIVIGKDQFEITTFRKDSFSKDLRHPESVTFSNAIEDDLSRRDFTMNAIAYNPTIGFVDPFNGIEHIKNHMIISVGDPIDRFNEDALRMMRAVRFSAQLNFVINNQIRIAILKLHENINFVSKERIKDELSKILLSNHPDDGINDLINLDLMQHIIPELCKSKNFDQKNYHHSLDVLQHTLKVVTLVDNNIISRLAALYHDIGKPNVFELDENDVGHFKKHADESFKIVQKSLKELKFDNNTIHIVSLLVKEHMNIISPLKKSVKKLIIRVGKENLNMLFDLQIADRLSSAPEYQIIDDIIKVKNMCKIILTLKEPTRESDLDVSGDDIIKLGFKQGKIIGEIKRFLLEVVLNDPEKNNKEQLIQIIKDNFIKKEEV